MKTAATVLAGTMLLAAILTPSAVRAADNRQKPDREVIKTGYNFGPLPVVAYDADKGFQYGALHNIYNFADGSSYPDPKSSWYIEASAYTKGSQKYVVSYDNTHSTPDVRLCAAASIIYDKAIEFFGYNGYRISTTPKCTPDFCSDTLQFRI